MGSILKSLTTLDGLDVKNKRVLLRGDLNVPMSGDQVRDEERIRRLVPTIRELSAKGARIILLSHLGRPDSPTPALSLRQVLPILQRRLAPIKVSFAQNFDSTETQEALEALGPGEVLLLENLRFFPMEEKNDASFAQKLADLGDIYINDAFSVSHRAHASVSALPELMSQKGVGRLVEEELRALADVWENPKRPLMAIVGGAKIQSKLPLLESLGRHADILVLGGAMAVALLHLLNPKKDSRKGFGQEGVWAEHFMSHLAQHGCQLVLPVDVMVKLETEPQKTPQCVELQGIPMGWEVMDIGPQSQQKIIDLLQITRTVLWNGPLGVFEDPPFDKGTSAVAKAIARRTEEGVLVSIAGGGDTGAALVQSGISSKFTYISAAGGAFLAYLEEKPLPGLQALI